MCTHLVLFKILRQTCILAALCLPIAPLRAQYPQASMQGWEGGVTTDAGPMDRLKISVPLQGKLEVAETVNASQLRVLLVDPSRRIVMAQAIPSHLGNFDVSALASGVYELHVVTQHGDIVHAETVSLPMITNLTIRLTSKANQLASKSVSLKRLQHKVPKKARKEFEKGLDAVREGDRAEAEEHLELAMEIDPDYFDAANQLGIVYMEAKRLPEAKTMFEKAVELDESDAAAQTNLCFALLHLRELPQAEAAARASLKSDASNVRAHFLLAVSLIEQRKGRQEAIQHLSRIKEEFVPAQKLWAALSSGKAATAAKN